LEGKSLPKKSDNLTRVEEFYGCGFCVLESVYDKQERQDMCEVLDACWVANGRPVMQGFGFAIHPLLIKAPGMAPFFAKQVVIDTMAEIFGDEVRLAHAGARVSDEKCAERISWHNHYSWESESLTSRQRVERVLGNIYPDGTSEAGNLVVLPRRLHDPIEPAGGVDDAWPGQVVVEAPPGSVVIFDTALWHSAHRGTRPGLRHLFGGHYQAWNCERPHPEDNPTNVREIERYKSRFPALKKLVEKPS
jgi:hypothetical protein